MITANDFPSYWLRLPLGEVASFLDHLRRPVKAEERRPGPFPYYGANGQQGTIDDYIFDEPLVLLAEDGGYFGDPERPIAYEISAKCWVNNHAHVLRPNKDLVETGFLFRVLSYYDVRPNLTGTTRQKLTKGDASKIQIPLPPLSEQRRIVEILKEADRLRKLRYEANEKAEHILPALFYKTFGDPATNPKQLPVRHIGDLIRPIEKRDPSRDPDTPFTYVDIAGVDGTVGEIVESRQLMGAGAPSRAKQVIRVNDVIVSTVRPYLRATALVPASLDNQIASTGFCVLRSRDNFGHGYLYALSRLQWFTEQLNARARGASYPAVTDADIFALRVSVPIDEATVREFDAQVGNIILINHSRRLARQNLESVFSLLLNQVFSGVLTAKWREAHMKELLAEMEQQAKLLNLSQPEARLAARV